jgi:hypothetical protein
MDLGTNTSKRGFSMASATAVATSSGRRVFPRPPLVPAASSVSTTTGITTLTSTPLPRSSSRTATLYPYTACLEAV